MISAQEHAERGVVLVHPLFEPLGSNSDNLAQREVKIGDVPLPSGLSGWSQGNESLYTVLTSLAANYRFYKHEIE